MSKITRITPSIAKQIDADVAAALTSIEAKWGVKISVGGGSYDPESFTTKLRTVLADVDTAKKDWDRFSFRFGLKPEQYGTTFTYAGETFTVAGIAPKAKKFPIIGTNARGTRFKFPADALK